MAVRVYPAPALAERGEFLPGVGIDGADIDDELAAEWLAAGLATTEAPSGPPDDAEGDPADGGETDAEVAGDAGEPLPSEAPVTDL